LDHNLYKLLCPHHATAAAPSTVITTTPTSTSPPPKRGRGRPRKNPIDGQNHTKPVSTTKRKRSNKTIINDSGSGIGNNSSSNNRTNSMNGSKKAKRTTIPHDNTDNDDDTDGGDDTEAESDSHYNDDTTRPSVIASTPGSVVKANRHNGSTSNGIISVAAIAAHGWMAAKLTKSMLPSAIAAARR
jgi:hypothetical protein